MDPKSTEKHDDRIEGTAANCMRNITASLETGLSRLLLGPNVFKAQRWKLTSA